MSNSENLFFLRKTILKKGNKQKFQNIIPAYLNNFLIDIFMMNVPCSSSFCSIFYKILSEKDQEVFSKISYTTFYYWFRKVVEKQDQLRAQILKSAEFAHELNALNAKNSSAVNVRAAAYNNNLSALENSTKADVVTSPAAALPEPAVKTSQAPATTFSPGNVSVNNYEVKPSPQVVTDNLSVEENDPWANTGNDSAQFLTPDEIEKQKKDKERQDYLKTRKEFCPLPVLPLTHLDPDDPRNPVRTSNRYNEIKHQKLFYDQRGMIFDGASAENENEYMPIPRLFQLNNELITWDNQVNYAYNYTLKESNGKEQFGSKTSRQIYSFVISNFGPYMGQKCSFWFINKT